MKARTPWSVCSLLLAASLALAMGGLGFGVQASRLLAQSERHGIHVHYTSLGGAGGLEGRAFLPVGPSALTIGPHPDAGCAGFTELSAVAKLSRGPLRALSLRAFVPRAAGRVELGQRSCGRASIETTLENGVVVQNGQGYIEVTRWGAQDPIIRGSFSQTALHDGVPVTIEGNFVWKRPTQP